MSDGSPPDPDICASEDEVMKSGFRTPALSQEALERIRVSVEREWRVATSSVVAGMQRAAPASRAGWFALAAAAALAGVAVAVWVARPPSPAAGVGLVSRMDGAAL